MIWYKYNNELSIRENVHEFLLELPKKLNHLIGIRHSNFLEVFCSNKSNKVYPFWIQQGILPSVKRSILQSHNDMKMYFNREMFLKINNRPVIFDFEKYCNKINAMMLSFGEFISYKNLKHCDLVYKIVWELQRIITLLVLDYSKLKPIHEHLNSYIFAIEDLYFEQFSKKDVWRIRIEIILEK